jgi:hypothetical protein
MPNGALARHDADKDAEIAKIEADNAALREQIEQLKRNHCVGYPSCDGDLEGTEHSPECPCYKPAEPKEKP